jgi:hypothetical protein
MDAAKFPLPGAAGATAGPAPGPAAIRTPVASQGDAGSQSPANIGAIADRADIRPLDVAAALQILLAEVRALLDPKAMPMGAAGGTGIEDPVQTARVLVEMAVQSLPDQASVPVWTAALLHMESALQSGLEFAIDAVSAWRDVPIVAVDAAKEARALVFSVLGDDAQNPIWLRPEWASLAPRLERFRRRRRDARRYLSDPDHSSWSFDDGDEQRY